MTEGRKLAVAAVVVALLIGLTIWWSVGVYHECRDAGHSRSYCLRVVSR